MIALTALHTAHRVAQVHAQEHLNQVDALVVQVLVVAQALVQDAHHVAQVVRPVVHRLVEVAAHLAVLLLVEVDVLVAVTVAVQHIVAIHAAHNAEESAEAVVICVKTYAPVAFIVVNNTAPAVQVAALDNATLPAKVITSSLSEKALL